MVNNENKPERFIRFLERNGIDLGKYGWIIALGSLMISNKGGIIGIILGIITWIVSVVRIHSELGGAIFMFFLIPILLGILGAVVDIVVKKRYWGGIIGIIPGAIFYVGVLIDMAFRGDESGGAFSALVTAFFTMIILGIVGMIIGAIIKIIAKIIRKVINPTAKHESSITANAPKILNNETKKLSSASEYVERGRAYSEKGDFDNTIADCTEAIQLDPNYTVAYFLRGIAYSSKGDNDKAIENFTETIQLDPTEAWYYCERGDAYDRKGDRDKAVADYNEAIRLKPDDALYYYHRGNTYSNSGNVQQAISDYKKSLELDSNSDDAAFVRNALRKLDGK